MFACRTALQYRLSSRTFSMIRFIVVFLVCLLVLFTAELLQPVQAHVIMPFTAGVAHVSAWIMLLFDHNVIARGNVMGA